MDTKVYIPSLENLPNFTDLSMDGYCTSITCPSTPPGDNPRNILKNKLSKNMEQSPIRAIWFWSKFDKKQK